MVKQCSGEKIDFRDKRTAFKICFATSLVLPWIGDNFLGLIYLCCSNKACYGVL